MRPRGPGPGIDHRLRVVLPEAAGDEAFRIHSYGLRELVAPAVIDRPAGTSDWLVMAFHQPAQVWVDAGPPRRVQADTLVIWRPHAPQRYGNLDAPWLHSWMHADGEQLRSAFDGGAYPLERPIGGVTTRLFDRFLLLAHEELSQRTRPDPAILGLQLQLWLLGLKRAVAGDDAAPPGLLAARAAIESRYAEDLDLAGLARLAGYSRPHFCTQFHRAFGSTPIQYLIRVRLRQAHLLMQDPMVGVAEAAGMAGFSDYRHFSRLYRRHFGHPARRQAVT